METEANSTEHLGNIQNILLVTWDWEGWTLGLQASGILVAGIFAMVLAIAVWRIRTYFSRRGYFEVEQAELGFGDSKIILRPDVTDRQVAYAIWVELSTRKIGLPIDLEDDVIIEIYDSWYNYFSVTRDLIKSVSVARVQNNSTQIIINLSIDVLNDGLRPHLTKWQARFRHWYQRELAKLDSQNDREVLDPQGLQKTFPQYDALKAEMTEVNNRLIAYRKSMQRLVFERGGKVRR